MSKQSIYQTLIQSGMTREAALGMMGNMQCESGLEANRVQGDFSSFRTVSKTYTANVDNGSIGRDAFGRAGNGYGLAQWTYFSRRYALFDFWKSYGGSIGNAEMQTKFCISELKSDYHALWQTLTTCNDLYTCTKLICEQYERPAHNNIDQRFTAAVSLKAELAETPTVDTPTEPTKEVYFPPRTIQKGMSGDDVLMLQAILKCRGYDCGRVDGIFDERTKNRVLAFQSEHTDANNMPLDTDGIAGRLTWGAIFKY